MPSHRNVLIISEKVAGSTLSLASSSRFLREVRLLCIAWWCHASARKEGVAPLGEDSSVEKIRKDACTFFVSKAHVSLCEPRARYGSLRAPSATSHQEKGGQGGLKLKPKWLL